MKKQCIDDIIDVWYLSKLHFVQKRSVTRPFNYSNIILGEVGYFFISVIWPIYNLAILMESVIDFSGTAKFKVNG